MLRGWVIGCVLALPTSAKEGHTEFDSHLENN